MRILVYPHDLNMGGSQLNAIEIGAGVRDLGHDVWFFGRPGRLTRRISELGLEFIESPQPRRRPSCAVVGALRQHVGRLRLDVLHGYEWPPALEAWLAARRSPRVAATATVMSMAVAPFIPADMPTAVGTREILAFERGHGRRATHLIEPPVDLAANRPGLDLAQHEFARRWGLAGGGMIVTVVTRLTQELKLEGVLTAIEAVARLHDARPSTLLVVGDGPARSVVERAAASANARCGRRAVILTGMLEDPRVAYSVADVALGMGGSALRALAFEKPLVVQGERGYWELLTPDSLAQFAWRGWYGVGREDADGPPVLAAILDRLAADPLLRARLGAFGLSTVRSRYSVESAARRQVELYEQSLHAGAALGVGPSDSERRAAAAYLRYSAQRLRSRLRPEHASDDDFNSRPVAGRPLDQVPLR